MLLFRFFIILFFITFFSFAQNATLSGVIYDKEANNEPLPFANVYLKNTSVGVTTDLEGKFELNIKSGTYTLVVEFLGYETIEISVTLLSGEKKIIEQTLQAKGIAIKEVTIETTINKRKESVLLTEQKKAVEIKQSIGAEELSRKGISDVATALTKTTGISKQEGSNNIYVRGLGDRYNTTTLNGLPLPSNNPSKKNIQLDLFNTDFIDYIGIDKTFNFRNYGDFAGANIDVVSKNYTGNGLFEIGLETGINSQTSHQKEFYLQEGPDKWGYKTTHYPNSPFSNYNFETPWNPVTATPFNAAFLLRGGKTHQMGKTGKLGWYVSGSFDSDYGYKEGIARGSVTVQAVPVKDLTFQKYNYNTNTTFLGSVNYKLNNLHTLYYNSLFINSSAQDHDEYRGIINIYDNASEGGGFVRRSNFERTSLWVNQLFGKHEISETLILNWGASYNQLKNDVPDRMQNTFVPVPNQPNLNLLQVANNNDSENHRLYQDLCDDELTSKITVDYQFFKNEDDTFKGKVTLGYNGRFKNVAFTSTQFNFDINTAVTQPTVTTDNIDGYFNATNFNNQLFSIKTFNGGLKPQTYDGEQYIHAGFIGLEYKLTPKFTAVVSSRFENIYQKINYFTNINQGKKAYEKMEILPSIVMKYGLTDTQNLKLAASKTYTLPQFKERAQFQFEDVTEIFVGNPTLYASTDYNADIKWEFFPKSNELVSLTAFGKYIQNPLNEIAIASASNDISFVNTGDAATVYGAEFELRKYIISNENVKKQHVIAGINVSYMYHNQDFNNKKVDDENDITVYFAAKEGKLTGASDLLLNADVSYFKSFSEQSNLLATLAYNYYSDRVFAIGTGAENKGNLIDKAVGTLDIVLKSKISSKLNAGFSVKNLLNPKVERVQDIQNVTVSSYQKGISYKLSLSYLF